MFKSISIQNFRGIKKLEINDLGKINVFVGDNATGKTAVLDAVYILINPNNPLLPLRTNEWRNIYPYTTPFWRSFFYNFELETPIELSARVNKEKIKLSIRPKIGLGQIVPADKQLNGEVEPGSSSTKSVIGLTFDFEVGTAKYKSEIAFGSGTIPATKIDQKFQEQLQGNYFNNKVFSDELDVATQFDTVNQEVGKELIIEFLKQFKSEIVDMELDRFRKLLVKDSSFGNKRIHLNTYGDGIVRGLHILLNIIAKKSGITLIDEIENGLHYSKQEVVWQFIHKLVEERSQQLFVATHSNEMLLHLYEVAKKQKFLSSVRLYRLQRIDNDLQVVIYQGDKLEYAMTHDLEVR